MADERSRKRLWEDFAFNFLSKTPAEIVQARGKQVVQDISELADALLEAHDSRWKKDDLRPGTLVLQKPTKQVK